MSIDLLCPSRGRPARFHQMLDSALQTAAAPAAVRVHLVLDNDDPAREEYLARPLPAVYVRIAERRPVPVLQDRIARELTGQILVVGADDLRFETMGWDDELRRSFAGRGPFAAGFNDGSGKDKWTHFAVSRAWIEAVGHLTPPFEHFCVDEYVERIAKGSGRWQYLEHVLVRHVHKKYDRTLNDATYASKRMRAEDGTRPSDRDEAMLLGLLPQIEALARRLRDGHVEEMGLP